ncbi:MAG: hypothetical protein FI734_04045 [SAR202 cluster bacterium]|nr:hypothetical protein [SAR202 cluster bacterium]|tara:strand:- start:366 stop:1175 length:810 start_codon:yes stop_codon:yes gene_type:complete
MKVVILTGNETRHTYFRVRMASDKRIHVVATYCEGTEKSLESRTISNASSSKLELMHVRARTQSEHDFFDNTLSSVEDLSNPKVIIKGEINNQEIVDEIILLNADILVCYGSSLIRSSLLDIYKGRFLNVHLGLSPYYRGSGTNVWPLINGEPHMVGATFMYIDAGIDTGNIIHQIRADIHPGDSPHSIGNRLISKMTGVYCDIVARFKDLSVEIQPSSSGNLYRQKDFNDAACAKLYQNFTDGMIENYLNHSSDLLLPYIVENKGLKT